MFEAISVSRYNTYIKQIFDAEELLHNIKIVGEVFGVSFSRNVIYFSLKDENASISCVCFYKEMLTKLNEGDNVIITGSPNYYVKAGKLSFNVVYVEKAGQGILYQQFMQMKEKLESEGLFSEEHKKKIPNNIKRIGVITSKEGAVIHDIINVATRRNPGIEIVLFPCKVQGSGAEDEIAYAIEKFNEYEKIDVIVVARGGGSLEDLWAYNTEKVARAIFNANKPIISAIGHETDFTIADFVADLRAPTPSAAAELLTKDISKNKKDFTDLLLKFKEAVTNFFDEQIESIDVLTLNLTNRIDNIQNQSRLKFQRILAIFEKNVEGYYNKESYSLGLLENILQKLSPMEILKRGYAKVEQGGNYVDKIEDVMLSSDLEINLYNGKIIASPKRVEERKWIMKKQSKNLRK